MASKQLLQRLTEKDQKPTGQINPRHKRVLFGPHLILNVGNFHIKNLNLRLLLKIQHISQCHIIQSCLAGVKKRMLALYRSQSPAYTIPTALYAILFIPSFIALNLYDQLQNISNKKYHTNKKIDTCLPNPPLDLIHFVILAR